MALVYLYFGFSQMDFGRHDVRACLEHVLCEFALRPKMARLAYQSNFGLPMTQDALALSPVHPSRIMKSLIEDGYITRPKLAIPIDNGKQLRQLGDFDSRYLQFSGAREKFGDIAALFSPSNSPAAR